MTDLPAGYYPDPEQPGMARWWDGQQWTNQRSMNIRSVELENIRQDVHFIKTVVVWFVVLSVIGFVLMLFESF